MTYLVEKRIYKLMDTNGKCGFEVTVMDEGVEIDTANGLGIEEFISATEQLTLALKEAYGSRF